MAHFDIRAFAPVAPGNALDLSTEVIVKQAFPGVSDYQGTRAALTAAGLVPHALEWPQAFKMACWNDHHAAYILERHRPRHLKGPRKLFADIDWWTLRLTPHQAESHLDRQIRQCSQDLARAVYQATPIGQLEQRQHLSRYWAAREDAAYQSFKARICQPVAPVATARPNVGAHHDC